MPLWPFARRQQPISPDQQSHRKTRQQRALRARPALELLEDRTAPTVNLSAPAGFAVGSSPHAMAFADFNGDGILDLATTNSGDNTVSVLRGNGDGTFQPAVNYAVPGSSYGIATGDFFNDGKIDIVTANTLNNTISILRGNGDGTFQNSVVVASTAGQQVNRLVVGDFRHDGKLDLAVATYNGNLGILLGNGDGTFQPMQLYFTGSLSNGSDLAVGDLNGDGKLDVVMANVYGQSVSVFMGNGDGTFQPAVNYAVGGYAGNVALGDFSHDGHLDVAVSLYANNEVMVLRGNGDGTVQAPVAYAVGVAPNAIAAADLNGDGNLDLVMADNGSNTISVLPGNADGTFGAVVNFAAGSNPLSIGVADLNGDGTPDVVAGDQGSPTVSVLLNQGVPANPHLSLSVPASVTVGTPFPVTVKALDANNQASTGFTGTVHFASSDRFAGLPADYSFTAADGGVKTFTILLGTNGTQTVSASLVGSLGIIAGAPVAVAIAPVTLAPPIILPYSSSSTLGVAADFTGNGNLDLTSVNADNTVSVSLGNGDGTFQPSHSFAVGSDPSHTVAADFNGDGKLDLATSNAHGNTVSVLRGNGDGTFQTAHEYPVGNYPFGIAAADLLGNGIMDLVTSNYLDNTVSVLLGNGDGSFQTAVSYPAGQGPQNVKIADLNGDGVPDLVVADNTSSMVTVLFGNRFTDSNDADITFQAPVSFAVGSGAYDVEVGDFSHGGILDIASADYDSNTVSVLQGLGGGRFAPAISYAVGATPYALAVGDFNGDGNLDLAVDCYGNSTVEVLRGNGDGTFQPPTSFAAGDLPYRLIAGDFDHNGSADLAVANTAGTGLQILLSQNSSNSNTHSTAVAVVSSFANSPSVYGQTVTFTATVSSAAAMTPRGTVQFEVDGVNTGSPVTLDQNGSASFSTNTLTVASHTITAVYNGNTNYATSSGSVGQVVNPALIFNPIGPQTVTKGQTLTVTLSGTYASQNGMQPLPIGLVAGPVGASLGGSPANVLTWTPPPTDASLWLPGAGNGNDIAGGDTASLQNVGFAAGLVGQAFSFNGANSALNIPNTSALAVGAGDFTLEMWINFTQLPTDLNWGTLWSNISGSTHYSLGVASSHVSFQYNDGNGNGININSASGLNDGQWHHIAAVRNGATALLYVDGVLQASQTNAAVGALTTTAAFARIGAANVDSVNAPTADSRWFNGRIDEFRLFRRALSQAEIQAIVNADSAGIGPVSTIPSNKVFSWTPPPTDALVWLPGEGNANDVAGGRQGVTQGGVTYAPGMVGQAFSLDASPGTIVSVPGTETLHPGAFTLDAWAYTRSVGSYNDPTGGIIVAKDILNGAVTTSFSITGPGNTGHYTFNVALSDGTYLQAVSSDPFAYGSWHHVALTWDGSHLNGYVDGNLEGTTTYSGTSTLAYDTQTPLALGAHYYLGSRRFDGLIDEVDWFGRVLSPREIQALFASGSDGKGAVGSYDRNVTLRSLDPSLLVWQSADGGGRDLVGGEQAILRGNASYATGYVGQGFSVDATPGTAVTLPGTETLNPQVFTLDAWALTRSVGSYADPTGAIIVDKDILNGSVTTSFSITGPGSTGHYTFNVVLANGTYLQAVSNDTYSYGAWHHVALSWDGTNLRGYVDGNLEGTTIYSGPATSVAYDQVTPLNLGSASNGGRRFDGLIDEVDWFDRVLAPSEIQAIYEAGSAGKQSLPAYSATQSFTIHVSNPLPAGAHLQVSEPTTVTAGTPFAMTVAVLDDNNQPVTNFIGAVHFTSSDPHAGLPADYTFTAADAGSHTFSITLTTGGSQTVSAALAQNTGIFAGHTVQVTIPTANFVATGVMPFAGGDATAVGDFNGDGILDVITGSSTNNTLQVLLGNGDGTFRSGGTLSMDGPATGLVAADFNGDGKLDLAATLGTSNQVYVWFGNGGGTFGVPTIYNVQRAPYCPIAVDLNGDGKLDLVTANAYSANVAVLLNNGDGTFQAPSYFASGMGNQGVTAADLNGDGKMDLVTANFPANTISVLLGNGDGTFQTPISYATGTYPAFVTAVDLNHDGKKDLAVADWGSNDVQIYKGLGNGSFVPAGTYSVGTNPYWISAQDFNEDGNPDLAVLNRGSSTVSVLLGNGDSTFEAPLTVPVSTGNVGFLATGDFNGDGSADLLVTNDSGLVVLNNQAAPANPHLSISVPTGVTASTPFSVTVTALDSGNNVATSFTGTVHFASSDQRAGLPADYPFTAADAGTHTFNVTLHTGGAQTVSAALASNRSIVAGSLVTVSTYLPPMVSVGGPYTISEGNSLSLTGTASDPESYSLTYSWTINGQVGAATTASPTLTWAQLQALGIDDGPATFHLSLTVNDGYTTVTSPTATLSLVNTPPTPTIQGAPATSPEGTSISLTASASDPSAADTAAGFTFTWSVTKNGNPFASGTGASFSFTPNDNGTFAVTLSATDKDGGIGTTSQTITVTNVPPTASVSGPSSGVLYQPLPFTLGATDPSSVDQATGFTYAINWGDGSTNVSGLSGITATHDYTTAGNYTITLTATDKDGGVSQTVTAAVSVSATLLLENGILAIPGTATAATYTLTPTLPTGASAYSMKVARTLGTTTTNLGTFAVPSGLIAVYGGTSGDAVTLNGTANSDAFTLGSGTVSEMAAQSTAQATSFSVGLSGVTALKLNGAGGSDSLTGPNQTNAWAITGSNAGTLDSSTSFSSIANLTGGSGANTFSFADGGSISGILNGGGGSNTLDYSGRSTAVTVTLVAGATNKATATGGWMNIATVVGSAATTNTLVGGNTSNVWDLTGSNAGNLNGTLAFAGFENLTGGTSNDSFAFLPGGSITGNLSGGAPINTLDYSGDGNPVTVNLQMKTATGIGGTWSNVQNFIGTATSDLLVGTNANSIWSITGSNAGTIGGYSFVGFPNLMGGTGNDNFKFVSPGALSGTINGGGGNDTITGDNTGDSFTISGSNAGSIATDLTQGFSSIQNLTGGTGTNTFAFVSGGSISGDLSGGSGTNTLADSGYGSAITINLPSKTATGIGGTWSNVQSFLGTNTTDTLMGANANTWSITGGNAGTVGAYSFVGFPNLTGESGNDTFQFAAGASVSGSINGQGGSNTLDYSGFGSPVAVNLQSATATGIGGTWVNLQSFKGTDTTDTLIATDGTLNTWALHGRNAGTVDGVTFTGFANLTGGSGNDTFTFASGATVSGVLDGKGGNNTLDYSAYTGGVTVNLGNATTDLANNSATGINGGAANGISNIGTVVVGAGNNYLTAVGVSTNVAFTATGNGSNILVGGSGSNLLTASGSGNNIIIAGHGISTLSGGTGYNLLIGGYTAYDALSADWQSILGIWKTVNSATKYDQAISKLMAASYAYALTTATVHGNSSDAISAGTHALDWYFVALASEITGENAGETVTVC